MRIKDLTEGPKGPPAKLYRDQSGMLVKSDPKMVHSRPNYSSLSQDNVLPRSSTSTGINDLQAAAEREYHAKQKLDDLKKLGPPTEGTNMRKYLKIFKAIMGRRIPGGRLLR